MICLAFGLQKKYVIGMKAKQMQAQTIQNLYPRFSTPGRVA